MKTLNRILVSAVAVATLGTAQYVSATACPGPDTAGKVCQANPTGCDGATPPNVSSFRALFGNCPDDGGVNVNNFTNMTWYGVSSLLQRISSNGFIKNETCGADFGDFTNDCPLPNAATPNNLVAGIWDDWNCSATAAATTNIFIDIAPGSPLRVRYVEMPHFDDTSVRATFTTTLYATDQADVRVVSIVDPGTVTVSGTIGSEAPAAAAGLHLPCGTPFANTCTRFVGFTPPPTLQDVLDALAAIETKADAMEVKLDALGQGGGGGLQAIEAKLDAIQLLLTPPSAGCTLFNCK